MSTIRRQSIISSVIIYFGFAVGFLNTYLFTRQGGLTKEQFGLTNTFIAIASIMYSIANLGVPSYILKFFPYYKSHLPAKKNDQLTWALSVSMLGFLLVVLLGILLKPVLIDTIFKNSPELPKYFYWILLFGFGYTVYFVMEAYSWQKRQVVITNFLREVVFRLFVTLLIVLTTVQVIKSFDVFIGIYSCAYLLIAAALFLLFIKRKELYFTFKVSTVTRRFQCF
jgi:O-antigen/teichoic acid export membrane protein